MLYFGISDVREGGTQLVEWKGIVRSRLKSIPDANFVLNKKMKREPI